MDLDSERIREGRERERRERGVRRAERVGILGEFCRRGLEICWLC